MTPEVRPIISRTLAKLNSLEAMQELITRVDASPNTNQLKLLETPQPVITGVES